MLRRHKTDPPFAGVSFSTFNRFEPFDPFDPFDPEAMSRQLFWRYYDALPDNTGQTQQYRNGSYTGDWYAGRRHGQGIRLYRKGGGYKGAWRNGLRHGFGLRCYTDGSWFEGYFTYGVRHGPGVRYYPNGHQRADTWWRGRRRPRDRGGAGGDRVIAAGQEETARCCK